MKATLVSITQPMVPGIDLDAEGLIAYTARVSNPGNQHNTDTAPRLLRYLIANKHWSPFEMVDLTVEVETSRAIAAQVLRHWSISAQEFSQRYADVSDLGFETTTARRQDPTNRQKSVDDLPEDVREWFQEQQDETHDRARDAYRRALAMGIAKEQARFLLPLSTTTRMYLKASVRDWVHYLESRRAPGTQQEHRELADAIYAIFREHFPNVAEALEPTS